MFIVEEKLKDNRLIFSFLSGLCVLGLRGKWQSHS